MSTQLSVCIPTYNRIGLLTQTLDNLLPQLARHNIPVFIRDNGSTDGTIKMLDRYRQEKYSNLFVKCNSENLGFDKNLRCVVEDATTEYCWLFGDDDWTSEDTVDAILSALSLNVGFIAINSRAFKPDMTTVVDPNRLGFEENRQYEPGDHARLLLDTAQNVSAMSCMVIARTPWLLAADLYYPKDYPHIGASFVSAVGKRAYVIGKPLLKLRMGDKPMTPSWKYGALMVNWPGAIWGLPADYDDKAKRSVTIRDRRTSISYVVAARALGMYDRTIFSQFLAGDEKVSKIKKGLLYFVARVPKVLCNAVSIFYLYVKRPKGYQVLISDILETSC
jgi:glycosyltransferase involved in cell wall biosynthesis